MSATKQEIEEYELDGTGSERHIAVWEQELAPRGREECEQKTRLGSFYWSGSV